MICRFAGPTSGTVARRQSSLNSPRDRLAGLCRLRNNVADVLHEPLKIIPGLHEHGHLEPQAAQIKFLCWLEAVGGANSPPG